MSRFLNWKTAVGLIVIAGVVWFAFGRSGGDETQADTSPLTSDDIVTVSTGDLAASASASGQIAAQQRASLSVSGNSVVSDVWVRVGDKVNAGDPLVQLDTTNLMLNIANAEQAARAKEASLAALLDPKSDYEIAAAEADLASAQASYDDLLDGPSAEEIAISQASVDQANASIYSASATLNNTLTSVSAADLEAAKAGVVAAQVQLEQAQERNERRASVQSDDALRAAEEAFAEAAAKYDRLQTGADSNSVNASQAEVAAAASRRDQSQAELDNLLEPPTATELANAQYNLVQAQLTLNDLLESTSAEQITIAEAELAQAQLDLEEAQAALDDAIVVAPFDGLITAVNVAIGEIANGAVIELVNMESLELVLSVDEADLSVIAIGQEAEITLDTWSSLPIASEVIAISPSAAEDGSGITAYDVHVGIGESDLPIKIGMTADARLITEQRADALLVPNAAINADRQTGQYFVNLLGEDGTSITEVEITIGLRDDNYTQALSGVTDGDQLVIDYQVPVREGGPRGGDN